MGKPASIVYNGNICQWTLDLFVEDIIKLSLTSRDPGYIFQTALTCTNSLS